MSSIKHDVTVFNWPEASNGVIDAVVAEDSSLLMEKDLTCTSRVVHSFGSVCQIAHIGFGVLACSPKTVPV